MTRKALSLGLILAAAFVMAAAKAPPSGNAHGWAKGDTGMTDGR